MQLTPNSYREWHQPLADEIGTDINEFVRILGEPTWMTFKGHDSSRRRAIVTLLHGNEPSALKAIFNWIKSEQTPAVDLGVFYGAVNAALEPPLFSHRYLPSERDLNRCFKPPYEDNQGMLASSLLTLLNDWKPEAVVDCHNTSGHSEAFSVALTGNQRQRQIAQLFTRKIIVMHRDMGALLEHSTDEMPIVTVEFGGFRDPKSDSLARDCLDQFIHRQQLFSTEPEPMQVLRNPRRLEVIPGHHLHYSSTVQKNADITLFNTIDQLNFSHVEADTSLGWLGKDGINGLRVTDEASHTELDTFFYEKDGFLMTKTDITIFMATTDPFVAENDCLLYLTPDVTHH